MFIDVGARDAKEAADSDERDLMARVVETGRHVTVESSSGVITLAVPIRSRRRLAGVAFRDEAAEVIREQLRLLGTVVGDAGATVRTIDQALDERESLDSSVARRQFRRLLGFPNTLGWGT